MTATKAKRSTIRHYLNTGTIAAPVWNRLGYEWNWIDQENFDTSHRAFVRWIGSLNRMCPLIGWLNRTFHTRRVFLNKI